MVKREPKTKKTKPNQNPQPDQGLTDAKTIINAQMIDDSRIFGKFTRAEIISSVAALLSLVAVGLALWPVLTAKMANEKQSELSARVDKLSSAVENLATTQTELAKSLVEQQGLNGALKTDIDKLIMQANEQAETLAVNLRAEFDGLAQKLQETQRELLESLNLRTLSAEKTGQKDNNPTVTDGGAKLPAKPNSVNSEPVTQLDDQSLVTDKKWLPKWVDVPLDNMADWFSGLVKIRKIETEPGAASQSPQLNSESGSQ